MHTVNIKDLESFTPEITIASGCGKVITATVFFNTNSISYKVSDGYEITQFSTLDKAVERYNEMV